LRIDRLRHQTKGEIAPIPSCYAVSIPRMMLSCAAKRSGSGTSRRPAPWRRAWLLPEDEDANEVGVEGTHQRCSGVRSRGAVLLLRHAEMALKDGRGDAADTSSTAIVDDGVVLCHVTSRCGGILRHRCGDIACQRAEASRGRTGLANRSSGASAHPSDMRSAVTCCRRARPRRQPDRRVA
jgi:hypothetical protein